MCGWSLVSCIFTSVPPGYGGGVVSDNKFPFIKDLNSVLFFSLQHTLFKEKRGNEKVRVVMRHNDGIACLAGAPLWCQASCFSRGF